MKIIGIDEDKMDDDLKLDFMSVLARIKANQESKKDDDEDGERAKYQEAKIKEKKIKEFIESLGVKCFIGLGILDGGYFVNIDTCATKVEVIGLTTMLDVKVRAAIADSLG